MNKKRDGKGNVSAVIDNTTVAEGKLEAGRTVSSQSDEQKINDVKGDSYMIHRITLITNEYEVQDVKRLSLRGGGKFKPDGPKTSCTLRVNPLGFVMPSREPDDEFRDWRDISVWFDGEVSRHPILCVSFCPTKVVHNDERCQLKPEDIGKAIKVIQQVLKEHGIHTDITQSVVSEVTLEKEIVAEYSFPCYYNVFNSMKLPILANSPVGKPWFFLENDKRHIRIANYGEKTIELQVDYHLDGIEKIFGSYYTPALIDNHHLLTKAFRDTIGKELFCCRKLEHFGQTFKAKGLNVLLRNTSKDLLRQLVIIKGFTAIGYIDEIIEMTGQLEFLGENTPNTHYNLTGITHNPYLVHSNTKVWNLYEKLYKELRDKLLSEDCQLRTIQRPVASSDKENEQEASRRDAIKHSGNLILNGDGKTSAEKENKTDPVLTSKPKEEDKPKAGVCEEVSCVKQAFRWIAKMVRHLCSTNAQQPRKENV